MTIANLNVLSVLLRVSNLKRCIFRNYLGKKKIKIALKPYHKNSKRKKENVLISFLLFLLTTRIRCFSFINFFLPKFIESHTTTLSIMMLSKISKTKHKNFYQYLFFYMLRETNKRDGLLGTV